MTIKRGSAMQNLRRAPLRAAAPKLAPGSPSSRSLGAVPARARGFLGIAFGKDAAAASTAHAKAASAHILALTIDHGLVAAGVAAAIGSASFASFMIARDNSHPLFGGIEHLMIFAQPIGASGSQRPPSPEPASTRSVDYDATGSINRPPPPRAGADGAGRPQSAREDAGQPDSMAAPVKGYVLRFTRKGAMVVDGPKGSFAAAPGIVLPDRGRILSIQNRNGRWVVLTENGVITEPAP
ncbi:MAG: hypothetical protein ACLPSF_06870 [Methylocella sp.]